MHENILQDVCMGGQDFILLEGLEAVVSFEGSLFRAALFHLFNLTGFLDSLSILGTLNDVRSIPRHEGNIVVVDDALVSALDFEIVGYELDGACTAVVGSNGLLGELTMATALVTTRASVWSVTIASIATTVLRVILTTLLVRLVLLWSLPLVVRSLSLHRKMSRFASCKNIFNS